MLALILALLCIAAPATAATNDFLRPQSCRLFSQQEQPATSRARLLQNVEFGRARIEGGKTLKHRNQYYGFEVVTKQEQELIFNDIISVADKNGLMTATYDEEPQSDFVRDWSEEVAELPSEKRWSPEFGQCVKLDSALTWKDLES